MKITIDDVLKYDNIKSALDYLLSKNDSAGADGVFISDLPAYWEINKTSICNAIKNKSYQPNIIQNFEILMANGKRRIISKFTSIDRLILRAITQVLSLAANPYFSDYSFAYRENLSTYDAACTVVKYLNSKLEWCAQIDIKNFFDNIPQDILLKYIDSYIEDDRLKELLRKYLYCSVSDDREIKQKMLGIVQGSPLSPLLSNIYLNELDHILEEKEYKFCRFADNINVYSKTAEEANEGFCYIKELLCSKFKLPINNEKSGIYFFNNRRYLGFSFEIKEGQGYIAHKVKKQKSYYNKWGTSSIQMVDQNYHIISDGIIAKKDFTVLFENESGKNYLPVETMGSLNVYSNITFTSNFFEFADKKGLKVNLYNNYGNYIGSFVSASHGSSGTTLIRQSNVYCDKLRRMNIAKSIITTSVHNMRANLKYYYKLHPTETLKQGINNMSENCIKMNETKNIEDLMLIEARNRQQYFACFNEIIRQEDFKFIKRTKRPPRDALNSLISFGNTCLYQRIATEIYKRQLDIRIGFLHATNRRQQSLNLDIAEIFKPIIIDRTIFKIINKGMINSQTDFEKNEQNAVFLNDSGKKIFLREYEYKLYTKVTVNNIRVTYDTLIREEIRKIFRTIHYGEQYKPYKYIL